MPKSKTAAINDFQRQVHAMNTGNARELRLSAQQARNLSLEISELLAALVDQESDEIQVQVAPARF